MEILKKLSNLLYHNLVEWRWVRRVVKKEKFAVVDQSKRQLISQNWSVTLTLILMNQLTWPLINFL